MDKELDKIEVEFLHGVPVKLPATTKQQLITLISKTVNEARLDELRLADYAAACDPDGMLSNDYVKYRKDEINKIGGKNGN